MPGDIKHIKPGCDIGNYRLNSIIGQGTYGACYDAEKVDLIKKTKHECVFKILFKEPKYEGLTPTSMREISFMKHLAKNNHPHIVKLHEILSLELCKDKLVELQPRNSKVSAGIITKDIDLMYTMEKIPKTVKKIMTELTADFTRCMIDYIEERSGEKLMTTSADVKKVLNCQYNRFSQKAGAVAISERLHNRAYVRFHTALRRMFRDLLEAIAEINELSIIHRDIKFDNLMFTNENALKLIDFGLARSMDTSGTYISAAVSLPYRDFALLLGAPANHSSLDIWSIAVLMLELFKFRVEEVSDGMMESFFHGKLSEYDFSSIPLKDALTIYMDLDNFVSLTTHSSVSEANYKAYTPSPSDNNKSAINYEKLMDWRACNITEAETKCAVEGKKRVIEYLEKNYPNSVAQFPDSGICYMNICIPSSNYFIPKSQSGCNGAKGGISESDVVMYILKTLGITEEEKNYFEMECQKNPGGNNKAFNFSDLQILEKEKKERLATANIEKLMRLFEIPTEPVQDTKNMQSIFLQQSTISKTELVKLLLRMLELNPTKRPSAAQLLSERYFSDLPRSEQEVELYIAHKEPGNGNRREYLYDFITKLCVNH